MVIVIIIGVLIFSSGSLTQNKWLRFISIKKGFKNAILIFYYVIQLIILGLSFYVYTSIIEIFPWYEPLAMGAFFGIMFLIPIQGLIAFIIGIVSETLLNSKKINSVSNINTGILIFTFIICAIKPELFLPIGKIFAVIETVLIIDFIRKIIK